MERAPDARWREWRVPAALAAATALFFLLTTRGYGYFRDELYYLASAEHLGWGYVEHPPMIGWLAAVVRATLGDSLFAARLLPALAGAAVVGLTAVMARRLGGGSFAQILAGVAALAAPVYLALFSYFSMNAFDVLFWALGWWLLLRLLDGGDPRLWLVFGAVMGVGLENKISPLFLGFGVAAGLVLARRWDPLRRPWPWFGGALAGLLFLPHLLWQAAHGWPTPEFMDNARRLKNVAFPPGEFLLQQVLQMGPLALPVWLAGLAFLLFAPGGRPFRAAGWAYLAILGLLLALGGAKPYYLAPAYTVLFAAGGAALARWTAGRRGGLAARAALLGLVIAGGALVAPLAKPLLPVETYVRYAEALGVEPGTEERQELGRLPQQFADMHGWPELAAAVAEVYHALPPAERARTCVFAQNYGQAGALDVLGRPLGLPPALSGHNSYYLWGPRDCTGEVMIVLADERDRLEELFDRVELAATFTCRDCMPYENHKPIWVARGLKVPLAELWPEVKHYI